LTGEFIRQDKEGEWICPKSKEEVLKKAGGSADDRRVHLEEARDDHEICAAEEYMGSAKAPKR
jgi:hypothetical protein